MGACVSKPWEIDSQDICQRLRCFFACCKGQIVIHTTEVDGAESRTLKKMSKKICDPRLVWPYSLLLCGPTGCGKTTRIVELLKSHEEMCTQTPKNSFGFMVLNNQNFLKLLKKFGPNVNVNLLKVLLKT